jgi:uncharacterized membrane protein YbhN (UPF0104 family)
VSHQLRKQPHWKDSLIRIWSATHGKGAWKIYGMFVLMFFNWGIEAIKWQNALRTVQPIGFLQSFKAVFAGTCIASFTPNRVGEFMGRMLFVNPGNKVLSIAPTILCSMAQMLITLATGAVGFYLYARLPVHESVNVSFGLKPAWCIPLTMISMVMMLFLGLVYFRFDPLIVRLNRWLKRNNKSYFVPDDFSFKIMLRILGLSFARYGVFIIQYYLLFSFFETPLSIIQVFTGVSVMFVLMAIVPTLTILTDIGFRWTAGIAVFQIFTADLAGILAVSLVIWLVNLIIPALIGSLLILRIKLFDSK